MGIFGLGKNKEKLREGGLTALENGNSQRGLALLEKAAGQGDTEAMTALGHFYDGADPDIPRDPAKALEWFSKAAKAGSADAAMLAGELLSDEKTSIYSNRQAVAWFEQAAAMGDVRGMLRAGKMYLQGTQAGAEPVNVDVKKALKLLEAAADAGNTEAQYLCGDAYFSGRSGKRDTARGAEYLEKAAEAGDVRAQYTLGLAYQAGNGVLQDTDEAIRWFRQAAESEHVPSRQALGRIYFEGDGVPKDMDEAFRWYRLAAKRGSGETWARLGEMYHDGLGTRADINQAIWWMKKAADEGVDVGDTLRRYQAEANAGKIAWIEEKTAAIAPANFKTASIMQQAAVQLGLEGSDENALSNAFADWHLASEAGDGDAAFNCGLCCLLGLGTTKSPANAEAYFTRAAKLGDHESARNLERKPLDYQTLPCQKLRLPPEARQWILELLRKED